MTMADDDKDDARYGATDDEPELAQTEDRETELKEKAGVRKACLEIYKDVEKAFSNQWERANSNMDYWDIYNCQLGPNQFYSGNSKIYAPICHDAINARVTRFKNQLFPQSGKHVEVTASEEAPHALMSLLEFYVRKCKLRSKIFPALMRNGDIEGQYNIYVGWTRNERHVAMRVHREPTVDAVPLAGADPMEDIVEETIIHQYPHVEVIADSDVVIVPTTASSVEGAIDAGGSISIIRRWSKAKIRQMIRDEEIDKEEGELLLKTMNSKQDHQYPNKTKAMADAAGIKVAEGGNTFAQGYETWTKLKVEGERRICKIYFGGDNQILAVKRNPYWCDKVPLLSAPIDKVEGSFKGMSKLKFVDTLQYGANDAINEGMDAAAYALMPIIMTDPEKNPRVGSMVLNVAAIWETNPNDTKFAQFPPLWKDAFAIVNSAKEQIFQTMSINPAMMPQQVMSPGKKPNAAMIANEQQVDILSTADVVSAIEDEIATPLLQWFIALDHQFRDKPMTIRAFGKMGIQAEMEEIEPVQMDRRFEFRWFGVEQARNSQQLQQKMAGLNVIRGIPPQLYQGYKLDLVPVISQFIEDLFGPRLAPQIFKDIREELTLKPDFENELLKAGYPLVVNPLDDDAQHMQAHMQIMQAGDYHGTIREHMMRHQMQMQAKQAQQIAQAAQQMAPGGAGQPGVAGTPRVGASPAGARSQGPPGMIHQDRMAGQGGPPRLVRG